MTQKYFNSSYQWLNSRMEIAVGVIIYDLNSIIDIHFLFQPYSR